jgi:ATPase subunit of ABC transporter with duplicated ATPase domains
VINQLVEANVAMKRISEFLNAPDHPATDILEHDVKRIEIKDGAFTYQDINGEAKSTNDSVKDRLNQSEKELALVKAMLADAEDQLARLENRPSKLKSGSESFYPGEEDSPLRMLSLRQLNFECSEGEFIVVVGRVGAGKSTFLRSMLGEVGKVKGTVKLRGKIAYFDQKPFIMNDTIKGNILFGKPDNNQHLYDVAIKASCMEHDLQLLPDGDECEIGVSLLNARILGWPCALIAFS